MHRFYTPLASKEVAEPGHMSAPTALRLAPDEMRHAAQVLRLSAGEAVECFDGAGNAYAGELHFDAEGAYVGQLRTISNAESPLSVTLYQGMPKADKLELIVQKAAELGAVRVVPVLMRRSVARPDARDAAKKVQRMNKIALEASKQSGRSRIMNVADMQSWAQAIAELKRDIAAGALVLMPYECVPKSAANSAEASKAQLAQGMLTLHNQGMRTKRLSIIIGPEGGIDTGEAEQAAALGAYLITLGPRILRTETAGIASIAQAMLLFGDAGGDPD